MKKPYRRFLDLGRLLPALFTIMLVIAGGCIKNDIPYPRLPQTIRAIACEGEERPASIDSATSLVTLHLLETTDIQRVKFTDFTTSPGASVEPDLLEGTFDLTDPIVVTLSLYQSYQWVIKADQHIDRYFNIEGQIGASVIDPIGRRVIVKIPENFDLADLTLIEAKLGPAGITTTVPALTPGRIDLSRPLEVKVTAHSRTETWTVFAERTAQIVSTTAVDAWSKVIWMYGAGPADVQNSFEWRRDTETQWVEVPVASVTQTGGTFAYCLTHLEPMATYQVRAVSGTDKGNTVTVTTEATEVLPDGSFDLWSKTGAVWFPYPEGGPEFWDTGNTGAATLGKSNVTPSDHVPEGLTGQSACLETRFVGIGVLGKLAAGSIYTGKFVATQGTNGILDFGRPWTVRPTALRGYYQYTNGPINYTNSEWTDLKGRPDTCHIYIALTDWTAPYQIRTNPKDRQLMDFSSPAIIALGELLDGDGTDGYKPFRIELKYRSTSRRPTYIQITAAASKYGDYFTGSTSSVLYVDDFSLDYDYQSTAGGHGEKAARITGTRQSGPKK